MRVRQRVAWGGHDIPGEKILEVLLVDDFVHFFGPKSC